MTTKQIYDVIETGKGLKSLAESYTEIASIKLKHIRNDVERNRAFFDELTKVYAHVKNLAIKEKVKLNFKTKDTVSIIMTSNYRFYGNINTKLSEVYYAETKRYKTDKVIIGKTGQEYLRHSSDMSTANFVVFNSDMPNEVELQNLANFIQPYSRVLIYYSQLKSVLVQLPVIKDITQSGNSVNQSDKAGTGLPDDLGFILEPEISEMLVFFDTQINAILLQEAFLEAELSRTAARLISMDQAQTNADDYIKKQQTLLGINRRLVQNMRVIETINAFAKVKKDKKGI